MGDYRAKGRVHDMRSGKTKVKPIGTSTVTTGPIKVPTAPQQTVTTPAMDSAATKRAGANYDKYRAASRANAQAEPLPSEGTNVPKPAPQDLKDKQTAYKGIMASQSAKTGASSGGGMGSMMGAIAGGIGGAGGGGKSSEPDMGAIAAELANARENAQRSTPGRAQQIIKNKRI